MIDCNGEYRPAQLPLAQLIVLGVLLISDPLVLPFSEEIIPLLGRGQN